MVRISLTTTWQSLGTANLAYFSGAGHDIRLVLYFFTYFGGTKYPRWMHSRALLLLRVGYWA